MLCGVYSESDGGEVFGQVLMSYIVSILSVLGSINIANEGKP